MRKFSVTRADLKRILIAGTIVAVLDGTFAFCAYVVVVGRYNFESLLQYTASGLLGNDAFGHHGLTGWLLAALGATLHFAISFTVAAVFFVALRRFARKDDTAPLSLPISLSCHRFSAVGTNLLPMWQAANCWSLYDMLMWRYSIRWCT